MRGGSRVEALEWGVVMVNTLISLLKKMFSAFCLATYDVTVVPGRLDRTSACASRMLSVCLEIMTDIPLPQGVPMTQFVNKPEYLIPNV